ncbi:MAG: ATP-binding protein, partial [Planctomycetota bacterium]
TLLKQGRAFGLGCILATQNPVDLDYKALSNAGTWFLGRLQTERDKMRVLDGLEGASVSSGATFNRAKMEAALSGLDSRVFVMNNVHEDEPVVFHTRWAMSYLRGPMTRSQVRQVMSGLRLEPTPTSISHTPATAKIKKSEPAPLTQRPQLSAEIPVGYLEPQSGGKGLVWRPALFGKASIHFSAVREGVDIWRDLGVFVSISKTLSGDVWEGAKTLEAVNFDIEDAPAETGRFTELPTSAKKKKSYTSWTKALKNHLYREQSVPTYRCATLKERSKPGESEGEFRGRIQVVAREERDLKVEKLRRRYTGKLRTLEKRVQRAEQKVEREQSQYNQQKSSTAISFGATILGALFGRKVASRGNVGRAASTMKGVGRAARERGDIKRAEESLDALREDYAALEAQFTDDLGDLEADLEDRDLEISEKPIRLRKSDTEIQDLRLLWTPWIIDSNGIAEPDFDLD